MNVDLGMSSSAKQPRVRTTRCVIWHPRGQGIDPELVAALRSKSIELAARADNEFAAFSAICGLAKGADGAESATVLLIVDPKVHPAAGQLSQMVTRYPVRTVVWVYDPGSKPKLRAASARDFVAPVAPVPASLAPVPAVAVPGAMETGAPKLRLAGESDEMGERAKPAPSHLLTDEELALLLASEPRPTT